VDEDVHIVVLSILSGSHLSLVPQVVEGLRRQGHDVPVVAGGIIPESDANKLREAGVAAVYTPKDYELTEMLADVAELATDRSRCM
jgi:ethylmalonyl-CoA mutase